MNLTFRTYTINLLKFYIGHFKIDRRKLSISRFIHLTHLNTMKLLYENISSLHREPCSIEHI